MRLVAGFLITILFCFGQKPVIAPGGVVNAASYATGGVTGKAVTKGSLVSIFGSNLATTMQSASEFPLPTSLGGTTVSVNGIRAPLLYISPGQINIQVPIHIEPPSGDLRIAVMTAAGVSETVVLPSAETFGIFTSDGSGCGQASALNVASDGTASVNSAKNAASQGDYLSIFGTGIAGFFNLPPDGSPALADPLSTAVSGVLVFFDPTVTRLIGSSSWAGLAPGFVGLNQVNLKIPDAVREGCAVPLAISTGSGRSQPATISIRRGGGPCVDPPIAGFGEITWEKVVATGTSPNGESETFTAAFPASPGKQMPPSILVQERGVVNVYFGPSCPIPGYRNLEACGITIEGPGLGSVNVPRTDSEGQLVYRAVLPGGTIRPGSFNVTAEGGNDVGPFESTVKIGSGIQVTSSFPPGTNISSQRALVVNWSGGDPDTWVTVKLVRHLKTRDYYYTLQAPTSRGTVTFSTSYGFLPPGPGPADAEIVVVVTPDPADVPAISASGLSLGGRHLWKYTYRFGGLTIQ